MNESTFSIETKKSPYDKAFEAYKSLATPAIQDPGYLDLNNQKVREAIALFEEWYDNEEKAAEGDREKKQELDFRVTTFYYDAGFRDPVYLEDVLDWLGQDLQNAQEGEIPLPDLAKRIQKKIEEVEISLKTRLENPAVGKHIAA